MAKSKNTKKKIGGPFIAAAYLCTSVSEDTNGLVSTHQIVDEFRFANLPPEFPSKANPIEFSILAIIIIRRGDAPSGKHLLRLVMETPTGKRQPMYKQEIEMPAYPNGAVNIKARMGLKLHTPGVFWIDVIVGTKRLTRMALNLVIHHPADTKQTEQSDVNRIKPTA